MQLARLDYDELAVMLGFLLGDYRRAAAALAAFRAELVRLDNEAFIASVASLGRDHPRAVLARHPGRAGRSRATRYEAEFFGPQSFFARGGRITREDRGAERRPVERKRRPLSPRQEALGAIYGDLRGRQLAMHEANPELVDDDEFLLVGETEIVEARARFDLEAAAADLVALVPLLEPAAAADSDDRLVGLDNQDEPGEHERMDWLDPPPQLLALTDTVLTAAPPTARARAMHAA
jgi:hypothetical protein